MLHKLNLPVRRGDIYYADLSPVIGCEQGGLRPVLVIQNNVGNQHSPTVIVAAITGFPKKNYMPTHVRLYVDQDNQTQESMALMEQLRTIDKSRLQRYVGNIGTEKMKEIDQALDISVGLDSSYNT